MGGWANASGYPVVRVQAQTPEHLFGGSAPWQATAGRGRSGLRPTNSACRRRPRTPLRPEVARARLKRDE
eukprot:13569768-Alexandrium_andersonii.AAC.1